MAKRYDQETKDEVVAYVVNFNNENGRGGQSAAKEKYGLSPITIAGWMKAAGVETGNKKRKKGGAKRGPKPGKTKATKSATANSNTSALERMVAIQKQIDELQAEFDELKVQL